MKQQDFPVVLLAFVTVLRMSRRKTSNKLFSIEMQINSREMKDKMRIKDEEAVSIIY